MIDIFDLALWPTFQASTIKFCVFGVFILLRHTIHSGLKNNQKVSNQLFVYILHYIVLTLLAGCKNLVFLLASLTWIKYETFLDKFSNTVQ